jgi:hypothetical protein
MAIPDWQRFEILVAEIQSQLAPGALVQHNVRLRGHSSGALRQIDVLVSGAVGQFPIRIALGCRDYPKPVDVTGVGEFNEIIADTGVHKGVMVAANGFTPAAKNRAQSLQIDLYSPIDTGDHKWQAKGLRAPMICDFRSAAMQIGMRMSQPYPMEVWPDFLHTLAVHDSSGLRLGTILDTAMRRWESGNYPINPGERTVPIFGEPKTLVDNGGGLMVEVDLTVDLRVTQNLFLGHIPIVEMRGFRNELTGKVITNAFTTGALDAQIVEKTWLKVKPGDALPFNPVLEVTGLLGLSDE